MNKLKFSVLNKKIIYAFMICAVLFAAFQSVLVLKFYEPEVYLYAHGTALPTVFAVLISLFIIGVLVYCSLCKCEGYSDKPAKTTVDTRVISALCGLALLVIGIYEFSGYRTRTLDFTYMIQKQDKFILWSSVISFVAFIYFIMAAFIPEKYNGAKTVIGCVTIIWHVLYLLAIYFDMTAPLNDPIRLMNEFALVGIMMFLTVEIRFLCGLPKKGFYVGTAVVAFTLLLSSSVSNIIYAIVNSDIGADKTVFVYQLLCAAYVITRLLSQLSNYGINKSATPEVTE